MKKINRLSIKEKSVILAVILIIAGFAGYFVINSVKVKRLQTVYESSGDFAMGSFVNQKIYGNLSNPSEVSDDAYAEIVKLENQISWRVANSDIWWLNKVDRTPVNISKSTFDLLMGTLDVAENSDGRYDPTILPLTLLWGFDGNIQYVPDSADLVETRNMVNFKLIEMNDTDYSVMTGENQSIDLGSVGKGAACDAAVASYLKNEDVNAALITVGGTIGTIGEKPGGELWEVAVRDPRGDSTSDYLGTLRVKDCFISTSGDYEKFFVEGDTSYHHILDPKTGYPADYGMISATVICDSGALSDALSTACILSQPEDALALVEHYGAQAILVDDSHNVYITEGIIDAFTLTASGYTIKN